jgi:hypothetical protein
MSTWRRSRSGVRKANRLGRSLLTWAYRHRCSANGWRKVLCRYSPSLRLRSARAFSYSLSRSSFSSRTYLHTAWRVTPRTRAMSAAAAAGTSDIVAARVSTSGHCVELYCLNLHPSVATVRIPPSPFDPRPASGTTMGRDERPGGFSMADGPRIAQGPGEFVHTCAQPK